MTKDCGSVCVKVTTLKNATTNLAKDLMAKAGLEKFQGGCGVPEIAKIQNVLEPEGYQIKVFSKDQFNDLIYKGMVYDKNILCKNKELFNYMPLCRKGIVCFLT